MIEQSDVAKTGGKQIGLLGGSFNPAHGGHRRISLFLLRALALDEVWWVVSPGNPLRPWRAWPRSGYGCAPRWRRRAARRSGVTAIERELGTRYTVDTLRAIERRYPKHRFVWLMGSDNLRSFTGGRTGAGSRARMPIAVVARPGYDGAAIASPAMAWLRRFRCRCPAL